MINDNNNVCNQNDINVNVYDVLITVTILTVIKIMINDYIFHMFTF